MLFPTSLVILGTALLGITSAAPQDREEREERGGRRTRVRQNNVDALAAATLPSSCLPPPSQGLRLKYLSIGHGTQNYTCDLSNPTSKPVAIGAVADLLDASSGLSRGESHLSDQTRRAYFQSNLPAYGEHFFNNANPSRPVFKAGGDIFIGRRADGISSCPAPENAFKGVNREGAVDWLRLVDAGGSKGLSEVYRVVTAGGKAPATCGGRGQKAIFEVRYATQYWLYGA
ncbi:MAG: hypothetical protein M1823_000989 [Watsoniomyces obsoletus]|nr:MAG: hypothetical protein M1823_000989 [Watsoniomyces obsoletus]